MTSFRSTRGIRSPGLAAGDFLISPKKESHFNKLEIIIFKKNEQRERKSVNVHLSKFLNYSNIQTIP